MWKLEHFELKKGYAVFYPLGEVSFDLHRLGMAVATGPKIDMNRLRTNTCWSAVISIQSVFV
jgi:hypothetical protein